MRLLLRLPGVFAFLEEIVAFGFCRFFFVPPSEFPAIGDMFHCSIGGEEVGAAGQKLEVGEEAFAGEGEFDGLASSFGGVGGLCAEAFAVDLFAETVAGFGVGLTREGVEVAFGPELLFGRRVEAVLGVAGEAVFVLLWGHVSCHVFEFAGPRHSRGVFAERGEGGGLGEQLFRREGRFFPGRTFCIGVGCEEGGVGEGGVG